MEVVEALAEHAGLVVVLDADALLRMKPAEAPLQMFDDVLVHKSTSPMAKQRIVMDCAVALSLCWQTRWPAEPSIRYNACRTFPLPLRAITNRNHWWVVRIGFCAPAANLQRNSRVD